MFATRFEMHRDQMRTPINLQEQSEKFYQIMTDPSYADNKEV